jgi:anti-anti-sigma factor
VADPLVSRVSRGIVYRDRQLLVERTDRPPGFRFVGEIDISNSVAISHALREALDGEPHIHLDMRSLVFCDVSGIRALVNVGQVLGPDRRLLLHGVAPELERVIRLVGWADEPGLSFCGCTEVQT